MQELNPSYTQAKLSIKWTNPLFDLNCHSMFEI